MNKKELLTFGLITSLLVNVTIGTRYIVDTKELHDNIHKLVFKNYTLTQENKGLRELINQKDLNIKQIQNKSDILNQKYTDLTKENDKLKKELADRKEVSKRKLNMTLTYYVADCDGCSGITKTGVNVSNTIYYKGYRIIASDPKVIKLHSIVKIETENETFLAYAADTGGAIKGNILDVLVSSEKEAYKLGRQKATVTILKEGKS